MTREIVISLHCTAVRNVSRDSAVTPDARVRGTGNRGAVCRMRGRLVLSSRRDHKSFATSPCLVLSQDRTVCTHARCSLSAYNISSTHRNPEPCPDAKLDDKHADCTKITVRKSGNWRTELTTTVRAGRIQMEQRSLLRITRLKGASLARRCLANADDATRGDISLQVRRRYLRVTSMQPKCKQEYDKTRQAEVSRSRRAR
ncbi:hypothetical protein BKA93DRAFT_447595 [Sparassis latifolia]